jgi:hypothetical protein
MPQKCSGRIRIRIRWYVLNRTCTAGGVDWGTLVEKRDAYVERLNGIYARQAVKKPRHYSSILCLEKSPSQKKNSDPPLIHRKLPILRHAAANQRTYITGQIHFTYD